MKIVIWDLLNDCEAPEHEDIMLVVDKNENVYEVCKTPHGTFITEFNQYEVRFKNE